MANLRVQRRRGKRSDDGASLVEFALILPVFMMLTFGAITAGFALNEKQQMTHAAREGARYAATVDPDQSFVSGTWASNVRDLIVERSAGTLTASDEICVSLVEGNKPTTAITTTTHTAATYFSTATGGAACIADQSYPVSTGDDGVRVQVTASKPAEIDLVLFGKYQVTMDVEATGHSESN